ncbi:MAG: 23S rRNA (pseudouridine(1915)-N(3))-methyltransferase RlmH, partial [Mesorhizobium sp.]
MKITVHAVGRMKAGPERELADRYFERFAKSGPVAG